MTFAPPADAATDRPTAHEKAVDMVLGDREMVSRLLHEHQILHEAFQRSPAPGSIHDAEGTLVAWNALYERLHADDIARGTLSASDGAQPTDHGDGAVYRTGEYALPNGMTARISLDIGPEKAREAELVRARDEADAANRAKDDFLASMSHEIRTPMNGLMGMAGLLAESGLSKGQRMYADVILRSGRALLAITNDILDLSKIEAGGMDLTCASFDIADSIEETATLFAANADAKGLDLIVRIDPVLPRRLIGDESRLRQIVANLVGNAIKFTETGHVLVDIDAAMGAGERGRRIARLTCRVQDTGEGIAPDMCKSIFERFAQVDRVARRAQEGTGLGLAIVAALVEKMGGTIGVDSIEGEGTTFHFTIDLPVDASDRMRIAPDSVRGKRVLIVDSEAAHCSILSESVGAWGFEVASCRSMREAVAFMDAMDARGRGIDLVLLGERVTEGDAPVFTRALAGRTDTPPPVILIARLSLLSMCDGEGGVVPFDTLSRPARSTCLLASMERAMTAPPARAVAEAAAPILAIVAPEPEPEVEADAPAAALPEPQGESIDILVAEDNEINRFLIEEILRESGYSYRVVFDGAEAVAAWRSDRPRLVLMDVSMPRMSGDEATKRIRAEERGRSRTPIVALTAHALRGDRERCMQAGMDDHLTKPITIESIARMIDFHLQPGAEVAADAAG